MQITKIELKIKKEKNDLITEFSINKNINKKGEIFVNKLDTIQLISKKTWYDEKIIKKDNNKIDEIKIFKNYEVQFKTIDTAILITHIDILPNIVGIGFKFQNSFSTFDRYPILNLLGHKIGKYSLEYIFGNFIFIPANQIITLGITELI